MSGVIDVSLYLHIPFCTEKCDYCDFYSVSVKQNRFMDNFIERYTEALIWETERRIKEIVSENSLTVYIPSVYIGGGTPSLLGAAGISGLLEGLKSVIDISADAAVTGDSDYSAVTGDLEREITVEANPETADYSFLKACFDHGVTRLSLGIQSFDEAVLTAAGRRGWTRDKKGRNSSFAVLEAAKDIFGRGLTIDLMSGLPGQSGEILLRDIEQALSFNPGHISLYALTMEEGTPFARRYKKNSGNENSGDLRDDLWIEGKDALVNAGFEHYEVSNFALSPSFRSIHNTRYWLMKNWIGIGPGASGTIINKCGAGLRISYPKNTEEFVSACLGRSMPPVFAEKLDKKTILKETLMMGYRYCEGPDPVLFKERFGRTIEETIPKTLLKWQKSSGNLSMQETRMTFLNNFLLDAFMELDNSKVSWDNWGG